MDAAGHCRHKKHISGIAAAIVGLRPLPFKFSIVGACTASGMYSGIRLAISKLRIVDRGLLVKHQDILGLFQWSPVCIEKTCSALLVPNPLIAEHGEVGCAQHLVKGALCEKQHCAIRLDRPFHRLPQFRERQGHIPIIPGCAVGRIGQQHIHAMLRQGAQALDAVHEKQTLLRDTLSQSAAIGHYGPPLPWQAQDGRHFLFQLVSRLRPSAP